MDKKKQKDDQIEEEEQIQSDDTGSTAVSQDDFDKLQKELEDLKQISGQMEGQLKRAVADYQNLEKRVAEGRMELASWASSNLIQRILPVLSHFDKALGGAPDEDKKSGWFRGVELAVQQLQNVLKDEGLGEIETDGQFDPSLHEAVDMREGEHDKILEVVEKGYNLNGKVIRPAKVVVGRKG